MGDKTFTMRRRLAWGEADPAGTIYTPQAFDLAIRAIEGLWLEAIGMSFRELHRKRGRGTPFVNVACEFRAPLLAGEEFEIEVAIDKLGGASIAYRVVARRPTGEALFDLRMVSAMIDIATGRAAPIPDDLRASLGRYCGAPPL